MFFPNLAIAGFDAFTSNGRTQAKNLRDFLKSIYIFNCGLLIEDPTKYYFVHTTALTSARDVPFGYELVSVDVFKTELLKTFSELCAWQNSLKVGDFVTIAPRESLRGYPAGYANGMTKFAGKIVQIEDIFGDRIISGFERSYRYYLGDARSFSLKEDGSGISSYVWNSSMFVPEPVNIIKLELFSANCKII